jgi:hypothetical protein
MKKKPLFEIIDFVLKDDNIIVQIEKNNFVENSIVITVDKFKAYLDRHDKLYFEANDMSTGQLLTKAYTLTFDNYWLEMEREYKQEDLYDFISCTYIDFTKSLSRIEANLQTILTQFIW